MPFAIGSTELILLVTIAIPVAALYVWQDRRYRYGIVVLVCALLAAVTTPADLLSMLILWAAFIGIFTFGSRYRLNTLPAALPLPCNRSFVIALTITALAIGMLAAGAYYHAALKEHNLAHQAFRAWAFTNAGIATLTVGCTLGLGNILWRRA